MIYFRTRGGPFQGWGNVHRLASFARYCKQRGHEEIRFFVEGPDAVHKFLRDEGFETVELQEDISLQDEWRAFNRHPKAELIVMEMLECHYDRQAMLLEHSEKLAVFDDLLDHSYCADLVVCSQALPSYSNCKISDRRTDFLLGFEYFPCRPEFLPFLEHEREYASQPIKILVTFGGGRYDIANLKVAQALARMENDFDITFILGYGDREFLKAKLQAALPEAIIIGGVNDMPERLWDCDIAFVSAGYLKLEAAITGTPAVMIATQWHQIPLAEEFHRLHRMPNLGYMGFVELNQIEHSLHELTGRDERWRLAQSYRNAIDGGGMERIYNRLGLAAETGS